MNYTYPQICIGCLNHNLKDFKKYSDQGVITYICPLCKREIRTKFIIKLIASIILLIIISYFIIFILTFSDLTDNEILIEIVQLWIPFACFAGTCIFYSHNSYYRDDPPQPMVDFLFYCISFILFFIFIFINLLIIGLLLIPIRIILYGIYLIKRIMIPTRVYYSSEYDIEFNKDIEFKNPEFNEAFLNLNLELKRKREADLDIFIKEYSNDTRPLLSIDHSRTVTEAKKERMKKELKVGLKNIRDTVLFSLCAPKSLSPGINFPLNIWAYNEKDWVFFQQIRSELGDIRQFMAKPIQYNVDILFELKLPKFIITEPKRILNWEGNLTTISFPVGIPTTLKPGNYSGQIKGYVQNVLIITLDFTLNLSENITDEQKQSKESVELESRYDFLVKAFASYAHKDRKEVFKRLQVFRALGIDIFVDVFSIRQGAQWEQEIEDRIKNSKLFFLFWSKHASNSPYVAKEIDFALKWKETVIIQPIPLQTPEKAPPPKALEHLQFNDITLGYF